MTVNTKIRTTDGKKEQNIKQIIMISTERQLRCWLYHQEKTTHINIWQEQTLLPEKKVL